MKKEPGVGNAAPSPPAEKAAKGDMTERFGAGSHKVLVIGYVAMIAIIGVLVKIVLGLGGNLSSPPPEEGAGTAHAGGSAEGVLWKLLLASIVIIIAARLVGGLMRRIHQPQVIGEIIAGILLGPSLLGAIWPHATEFLFPAQIMPYLSILAEIGLIFYMFLVGLELDVRLIRGRGHAAVWVSHASIIAPFLLGLVLALLLFPILGSSQGRFSSFGLFMGASMSITAFPVLARILTERGLYKTRIGAVTLTCAAVDDVTAWCMLAVVVTIARASGMRSAAITIVTSLVFIGVMLKVVRPLMQRVGEYYEERGKLSGTALAVLFVGIITSALITDRIGIHAIFGAFLFGAIMPHHPAFVHDLTEKLEDFAVLFLLPIFFAFSGLRTEVGRIGTSPHLWFLAFLVLAVAILGKWGGSTLAAKVVGLDWREAGALGVLMNCRGLTELIILNIGLELGVLPSTLFAILVLMAVITTLMTEPLLALFYSREEQKRMVEEEGIDDDAAEPEGPPRAWKVLVPVANPRTAGGLVEMATLLARGHPDERVQITLLRVVGVAGTAYSIAPSVQDSLVEQATDNLRPLVEAVEQAGVEAVPLVVSATEIGEAIARVANERGVDLVLMGYHRAMFGDRLLGGTVSEVLREAQADVAVLVDTEGPRRVPVGEDATIVVPWGGGFHEDAGLELALRLGKATGAELALLGPASGNGISLQDRAAELYERSGVWTKPVPVEGNITAAMVKRASDADLLVMGVSDRWIQDHSLGAVREEVMGRAGTPFVLVRRHAGARKRLRRAMSLLKRPHEWMELTGREPRERVGAS